MKKFSKPIHNLLVHKQDLFRHNNQQKLKFEKIMKLYVNQPLRVKCVNCNAAIMNAAEYFFKNDVKYIVCDTCGHVNGAHEDTPVFSEALYCDSTDVHYSEYLEENYHVFQKRVHDIYTPKASFLRDALSEINETIEGIHLCDVGAGAGFFLKAVLEAGFCNVEGYEVSDPLLQSGNLFLGRNLIRKNELHEMPKLIREVEAEVLTLIGVLEHLRSPRSIFESINANTTIKYIFFSVPLFSSSVVWEKIFTNMVPRHLVAGHTHLYTESSINYFCREFGYKRISEWWFGMDFLDLFRFVLQTFETDKPHNLALSKYWSDKILPLLDDFQAVLDRHRMSSEVHMLVSKK